jgi:hypothetical protein
MGGHAGFKTWIGSLSNCRVGALVFSRQSRAGRAVEVRASLDSLKWRPIQLCLELRLITVFRLSNQLMRGRVIRVGKDAKSLPVSVTTQFRGQGMEGACGGR